MAVIGSVLVDVVGHPDVKDLLIRSQKARIIELETAIIKYKIHHTTINLFELYDLVEDF